MSKFRSVSIIMGAVTETDSLRATVERILNECEHSDLAEIIIGYPQRASTECLEVIRELVANQSDVPIVAFLQKREKLGFLTEAFDMAEGSHIITVDSDMALDLGLIPEMIECAKKEPETVFSASRWLGENSFAHYGKFKKALNFTAQKFLSVLYSSDLTDFTIPFQIISARTLKSIKFEETGFAMFLEMVLKPLRLGCSFKELPTDCRRREQGQSSNSYAQLPSYLKTAIKVRFMPKNKILK